MTQETKKVKWALVKCPYCDCRPGKQTLYDAIAELKNCMNCRVDINMRGAWTGAGLRSLKHLAEIHGLDAVKQAWKDIAE
jgi:hypothetical protein